MLGPRNPQPTDAALAHLYRELEGKFSDLKRIGTALEIVVGTVLPYKPISEAWWVIPRARDHAGRSEATNEVSFLMTVDEYEALTFLLLDLVSRCTRLEKDFNASWERAAA